MFFVLLRFLDNQCSSSTGIFGLALLVFWYYLRSGTTCVLALPVFWYFGCYGTSGVLVLMVQNTISTRTPILYNTPVLYNIILISCNTVVLVISLFWRCQCSGDAGVQLIPFFWLYWFSVSTGVLEFMLHLVFWS